MIIGGACEPFLHAGLDETGRAIAGINGVQSVHDLHVWTLSSDRIALSAHVVIPELAVWEEILQAVAQMLDQRYGIAHVTLQPGPAVRKLRRISRSDRGDGDTLTGNPERLIESSDSPR